MQNLHITAQSKPFIYNIIQSIKFLSKIRIAEFTGRRKKFPRVLQLPITYHCNAKCVMCNIWKMDYSNEMNVEEFSQKIKDPIFSKVKIVGINGGEPSLIRDLPLYANTVLKLPRLKSLNIITHGFNQKQLLTALENIYTACKQKNIHFHVSVSLDGYEEIHNKVRGLQVFDLTSRTINEIKCNQHKYCDSFDIACTVMKQNMDHLVELNTFAKINNYPIKYRLAVENKRIESYKLNEQYNLIHHNMTQSAKEFFHDHYFNAKNLFHKFNYFAIYYFLTAKVKRRLTGCDWKEEGITMDSRGDLYYCAVESNKIGSLRKSAGKEIFFSEENIKYRKSIVQNKCNDCIHDYSGKIEIRNIIPFLHSIFFEKKFWIIYFLKTRFA